MSLSTRLFGLGLDEGVLVGLLPVQDHLGGGNLSPGLEFFRLVHAVNH